MIRLNLSDIRLFLQEEGFQAVLNSTPDFPVTEQLIVNLGKGLDEYDLNLIMTINGNIGEGPKLPEFLSFMMVLPLQIKPRALKNIESLLLHLNAFFDMSFFGVFAGDRVIYYRYVHITTDNIIDGEVILTVIASLQMLTDLFLPALVDIALEKKSLEEVQHEIRTKHLHESL